MPPRQKEDDASDCRIVFAFELKLVSLSSWFSLNGLGLGELGGLEMELALASRSLCAGFVAVAAKTCATLTSETVTVTELSASTAAATCMVHASAVVSATVVSNVEASLSDTSIE